MTSAPITTSSRNVTTIWSTLDCAAGTSEKRQASSNNAGWNSSSSASTISIGRTGLMLA